MVPAGPTPRDAADTHTALHELGHATGHPGRLNRPTLKEHGGFGSEDYAREELRAEIAAMMTPPAHSSFTATASPSAAGARRGAPPARPLGCPPASFTTAAAPPRAT